MIFEVSEIEEKIQYTFKNKSLLKTAFTHSSYANLNSLKDNERMEFMGDAILEFTISEYLIKHLKKENEGNLTKIRSSIVSSDPLCDVVHKMDISKYLLTGQGVTNIKQRQQKLYSDLFESIVAAIYFDSGLLEAKKFILFALTDTIKTAIQAPAKVDYKSKLQEYVQGKKLGKIQYELLKTSGPDHMPTFTIQIRIGKNVYAKAEGNSKKIAEQFCAQKALEKIEKK